MSEQLQKQRATEQTETDGAPADDAGAAGQEKLQKLSTDIDGMLDEIDSVLEENAQQFVEAYVQRGGQ